MRVARVDAACRPAPHIGSPPHARGKARRGSRHPCQPGITPACAGKRLSHSLALVRHKDHPRMRGEKNVYDATVERLKGSTPHARGKACSVLLASSSCGITPACAGKRTLDVSALTGEQDHPHMRGEKVPAKIGHWNCPGSPPHARGKVPCPHRTSRAGRITPACAGKRHSPNHWSNRSRDHPRMRGEKLCGTFFSVTGAGSPPHARGKAGKARRRQLHDRITPACAGKSRSHRDLARATSDHPRMRGEKFSPVCIFKS